METDTLKKQLGLRLKGLRLAKGFKQEDLNRWGFSHRYYGRIERGLANITLDTLVRLCKIFEVSLSDLFSFTEGAGKTSEDREAVAVQVTRILKGKNEKKIRKLRLFLDDIL